MNTPESERGQQGATFLSRRVLPKGFTSTFGRAA